MNIRNRQPEGIPVGGQFASTAHAEAGTVTLAAPVSTLHRALDRVIGDLEHSAALLDADDGFMDDMDYPAPSPEGDARHAAYTESALRLRVLKHAGLEEGELAAALEGLGQELRARGKNARLAGRSGIHESIGTELMVTVFDNRDPDALLARRRAKIQALKGLQFEGEFPAGADERAMDRHTARLKLSGINGTVRQMQARGEHGKDLEALIETPDGRSYHLEMSHSTLTVTRAGQDMDGGAVSIDMGRGVPVTPEVVGEAFREAQHRAALSDAWAGNTRMRSTPEGVHPAATFEDYSVTEDDAVRVAAVTAGNSIGRYRVERIRSKATGEAETRIQVLGAEASKVSPRMTEAILADLSEAGGGVGTGAAFEYDLDRFAAAATADPAYRRG